MPAKSHYFETRLAELSDGVRSYSAIAELTGKSTSHVSDTVRRLGLPRPKRGSGRPKPPRQENIPRIQMIAKLSDGLRTSSEIAEAVGMSAKYVQATVKKMSLPRLRQGARQGSLNHGFVGGRRIDLDGYALVLAPKNHPNSRKSGSIYEHRLIAEKELGRYLKDGEVVDHIDGFQLHNHPSNLRVFASNSDHLKATISGEVPNWSILAIEKKNSTLDQRPSYPKIDSYRSAKERGDIRLRQILLTLLRFGEDSPYLLGTLHWLEQAGIRDLSRSSLELHLEAIDQRYTLSPYLSPL